MGSEYLEDSIFLDREGDIELLASQPLGRQEGAP